MSTDYPLLLNAEMVNAVLDKRKTQTRRPVKPSPGQDWLLREVEGGTALFQRPGSAIAKMRTCPYGKPGDILYVRENFWIEHDWDADDEWGGPFDCGADLKNSHWLTVWYCATDDEPKPGTEDAPLFYSKRPSIHMPKWASRLWLNVLNVQVQKIQDISETDAQWEGWDMSNLPKGHAYDATHHAIDWFRGVWDSVYGKRGLGWDINPWVWVITYDIFQVIKGLPGQKLDGTIDD